MDVGVRNGFRYMFGAVCRSTGKVFLQPLKKKSEAKIAITAFLAAEEAARRKVKFDNYRFYHEALNHSDSTAKALIDSGLVTNTARPPGFSCAACSYADPSGAHFRRNTKTSPSVPLPPYYHVEMDLWGPMDIGDRNGFCYMFGAVCRSPGKVFLHPL